MHTTIRRGATLLALLALGAPSLAQDQQAQRPAQERKPAEQQRPAAEKPAAERPAAERQAQPQHPNGSNANREAQLKRMLQEESRHRERLAKIERLRQIAQQKGDSERLSALGQMLKQENDRFFGLIEKARGVLDETTFAALEQRLSVGRGRGKDFVPPARERGQQPGANGAGRGEPKADRPKDAGTERPKNDGAQRDGNANGDAQRSGNPR